MPPRPHHAIPPHPGVSLLRAKACQLAIQVDATGTAAAGLPVHHPSAPPSSADLAYNQMCSATRFVALLGAVASFGNAHPVAVGDLGADLPPALLATGLGGLWRSTDGFVTRTKVIDGAVDKVEFQSATAVIATGEKIWRSTDAGATFSVAFEQKFVSASTFAVTRFSFAAGGVMGMAVAQWAPRPLPNKLGSTMLATTDGGATWARRGSITTDGSIYAGITALGGAESGSMGPRFARFALHGRNRTVTVDVTTDLGDSWSQGSAIPVRTNGLELQNAYDVDIFSTETEGLNPFEGGVITVTGFSKECALNRSSGSGSPLQSGVFLRSGDSGRIWTQELPAPNAHVTSNTSFGTTFYELAFAGNSACPAGDEPCSQAKGTMYAAAGAIVQEDSAGYVSRSDDGGTTWVTVFETFESNLRDVAVSPSRAGGLCAVGMQAALEPAQTHVAMVSCSVDGGKTWTHAPPLTFPKLDARVWETLSIALA